MSAPTEEDRERAREVVEAAGGDPGPYWLRTETKIHLDLLDRLRVLVTGRLGVLVSSKLEFDPGKAVESSSCVSVPKLGLLSRLSPARSGVATSVASSDDGDPWEELLGSFLEES